MSRSVVLHLLPCVLICGLAVSAASAQGEPSAEPPPLDILGTVQQRLMESAARGDGRIPLDPSELPGGSGVVDAPAPQALVDDDAFTGEPAEWEMSEEPPVLGDVIDSVGRRMEEAGSRGEGRVPLGPGEDPNVPAPPEPVETVETIAVPSAAMADEEPATPTPERKNYVPLPSKTLTIRSLDDLRSLSSEISEAKDRKQ